MTASHVFLRAFSESELIFDEEEARSILGFFFPLYRQRVEAVPITNDLRNLAQGLLVEAVDATFAMGWIELTFRWVVHPGAGLKKSLEKLSRRAARHWFKHLKDRPLADLKIYEAIRSQLSGSFRTPFLDILEARAPRSGLPFIAVVYYSRPGPHGQIWG